jgi:hypothetical protein
MRNKLGVLLTFTSILALFGCDKLIDESGDFAVGPHDVPAPGPGCESESEYLPHPYVSCTAPEDPDDWGPYDPACHDGCGGMSEADGTSYAWCNVECEDVSDCSAWDPGGSELICQGGRCKWYCDEDHPCPSELVCLGTAQTGGNPNYVGECWAPDPFAP